MPDHQKLLHEWRPHHHLSAVAYKKELGFLSYQLTNRDPKDAVSFL